MAIVCPAYNISQFSKPSKIRSCTPRRRCKDYSKPLHVDCSVEYELPNSAKPPVGSKNEPLLMIHPSYYRREESKHRSHFINNLPKRRSSSRISNSTPYGVACVTNRSQFSNYNENTGVVPVGPSPPLPPPSSVMIQKASNVFPEDLIESSFRFEKYQQPDRIPTENSSKASEVSQRDVLALWKRTNGGALPQSASEIPNGKSIRMVPVPKLPVPMTNSSSARIIDTWFSSCHNINSRNVTTDNNNNSDKLTNKSKEKSKKYYSDNFNSVKFCKSKLKTSPLCEPVPSNSVSLSVLVSTPSSAVMASTKQQQPAVGVAAIATPLNYANCCPPLMPPVQCNTQALLPQPWSGSTAPDFPSDSLPPTPSSANNVFQKRSLLLPVELAASGNTIDSRKRTADVSWWGDGVADSSFSKRIKFIVDENVHGNVIMDNHYFPQDQNCYNYSNDQPCGRNTWNRCNENVNLHLFRL